MFFAVLGGLSNRLASAPFYEVPPDDARRVARLLFPEIPTRPLAQDFFFLAQLCSVER